MLQEASVTCTFGVSHFDVYLGATIADNRRQERAFLDCEKPTFLWGLHRNISSPHLCT